MIKDKDIIFMRRALELAENGRGKVSPNPLVGCVIVKDDIVIGEGWHQQFGGPHAEVNAVNTVNEKNELNGATVYVTLEPCSHFGKTPPCADLLISGKVHRVVVCNKDPNPLVAGRGIEKLRQAGVEVETGMLAETGEEINKRFFCFHRHRRPYIILKWAETADGFIARKDYDSKWISNQYSRQLVHRWRAEEDAILVGKNTALYDNPKLTVRDSQGKDPIRLVLDPKLELPKTLDLFDETQLTICYNTLESESLPKLEFVKLDPHKIIDGIVEDLYRRNVQSVIIEGGSRLINSFLDAQLWDEARVFQSDKKFNSGIEAPKIKNATLNSVHNVIGDNLRIYNGLAKKAI